jgi:hypothetical protein
MRFGAAHRRVRREVNSMQTFRTSPWSYAALCGVLSIPLVLAFAGIVSGTGEMHLLFLSAILPATAGLWLGTFRLRLDDSGIEYRALFGSSFSVSYAEITSLKSRTVVYGRGFVREWILHLRDGRRLRLNLKPFPREAYGALCQRIRCDA